MTSYKLHYFNIPAKGNLIRMIFGYAGQEFEDVEYMSVPDSRPEVLLWNDDAKAKMPLGKIPVLEIDGQPFCQQSSIVRHLAKKFGLSGENELEELKVDMVQESMWNDVAMKASPLWYEEDEEKKKEFREKMYEVLPPILEKIDKLVDGDFVLGDRISLADFAIYDVYCLLTNEFRLVDLKFPPNLKKVRDNVIEDERVKRWLATRKDQGL